MDLLHKHRWSRKSSDAKPYWITLAILVTPCLIGLLVQFVWRSPAEVRLRAIEGQLLGPVLVIEERRATWVGNRAAHFVRPSRRETRESLFLVE